MQIKRITAMLLALTAAGTLCACTAAPHPDSSADVSPVKSTEENSSAEESSEAETIPEAESEPESSDAAEEAPAEPPAREVGEVAQDAITFEDGALYTAHQMGEGGDEADIELSVADLDGDKKLKVHVLRDESTGKFGVPKIVFNLPEMIGVENVGKIGKISVDFTCIANETWHNDDGTESLVVGNFLGALAGNLASEKVKDADGNITQNSWATHYEFKYEDWENAEHTWRCETEVPAKKIPANGYAENDPGTTLVIMRWGQANDVDFYIDNITFYDKDGNTIPITFTA
ncbi:MAG: hypothetical protein K5705_13435 [Oscillospiraceae bacterium]|nr:hypothetical protein [Oscillospiraceae bacterium]